MLCRSFFFSRNFLQLVKLGSFRHVLLALLPFGCVLSRLLPSDPKRRLIGPPGKARMVDYVYTPCLALSALL